MSCFVTPYVLDKIQITKNVEITFDSLLRHIKHRGQIRHIYRDIYRDIYRAIYRAIFDFVVYFTLSIS